MPTVWNLIISTIVFFVGAWYIHRYLDEQGIPKGATRGIFVLVFATILSSGAGYLVDLVQEKSGLNPVHSVGGESELLKEAGQINPVP
ncbi:MAG: hypothetical protein R8K48_06620 [Gallionella sp.]